MRDTETRVTTSAAAVLKKLLRKSRSVTISSQDFSFTTFSCINFLKKAFHSVVRYRYVFSKPTYISIFISFFPLSRFNSRDRHSFVILSFESKHNEETK